MDTKKLKTILENHSKWVRCEKGGKKADLRYDDLHEADLRCANLCDATLYGVDLHGVDLHGVDLHKADLRGANLRDADLAGADLRCVNLCGADLCGADLAGANLCSAILYNADLSMANFNGTDLSYTDLSCVDLSCATNLHHANLHCAQLTGAKNVPFVPMTPPESGSFIGWKKARNKIVKLLILEDAKRSSATSRKCRCDKAKVLAIENLNGSKSKTKKIASTYNRNFVYEVGKTVEVPDFCEDRWNECAAGIHFFVNRQEAVEY
ncbi:MAG: pentapeptide repeat-containing protein [Clostridia bacterium]|nr:pentapeptide repeat-containing protein [Clostridia bacterium]